MSWLESRSSSKRVMSRPEVGVVEGGLDLVHDVERARPRLEDRDEQGHRDEGALAAGEQAEPLDLLARRAGLDLDAGREHVAGSVRTSRPSPPGKRRAKTRSNWASVSWKASVKTSSTRSSTSLTMSSRSRLERLRSSSWVGEEGVPLLERRELLERERVDPAEGLQAALGLAQPLLLLVAHVGGRLGRLGGVLPRAGDVRDELVRAELLDEDLGVDAELLDGLGLELLDAGDLAGAGHLVAVRGVGEVAQLVLDGRQLVAQRRGLAGRGGGARPRRRRAAWWRRRGRR